MKQSRITGAISLMLAQAAVLLFGYATHLWIGRVLGPGPYGIFGVVLSVQSILGIFLTLGVPSAISRFVAQDEEHAHSILAQALKIQTIIALVIVAVTVVGAPLIARALNDSNLTPYFLFSAAVLFLQAYYQVFIQFLSGAHHFNRQAALTSIYATAKLAGAIGLLYVFQIYGAFAGFAIGGIVAAILGWYWTRSVGGRKKHILPVKLFLSFASVYVLILVGLQILMSLDLFMVKSLLHNDIKAGFYNAAVTISRIPYFLLQGLAFIILPSVSAITKPGASDTEATNFIRDVLRYLIILIIPSIALAATTSKELIILFYSRSFIPAAPVLSILIIGLGALAFYLLMVNIVAGANRARVGLYITIGLLVVSSILGTVLIPRFGLIGAAWQTTITSLIGLVILAAYTFHTFRIPVPSRTVIRVIVASAITVAPTYIWKATSIMLPIQYVILLGLYATILLLLGEVTPADRQRIANIHPRLAWLSK